MRKKYNIIIDALIKPTLDRHIKFASNVSTKYANSIRKEFYKILLSDLPNNPERFPFWLPDFKPPKPYQKILIKKRYLLLFYIDNNTVYIDYLLDCHMDTKNLFENSNFFNL